MRIQSKIPTYSFSAPAVDAMTAGVMSSSEPAKRVRRTLNLRRRVVGSLRGTKY